MKLVKHYEINEGDFIIVYNGSQVYNGSEAMKRYLIFGRMNNNCYQAIISYTSPPDAFDLKGKEFGFAPEEEVYYVLNEGEMQKHILMETI